MKHPSKQGHTKKHGTHSGSKKRAKHGAHHEKTPRAAARHAGHRGKAKSHHKCAMCGHGDKHDHKAGCTHFDGKNFCPCRHRG